MPFDAEFSEAFTIYFCFNDVLSDNVVKVTLLKLIINKQLLK